MGKKKQRIRLLSSFLIIMLVIGQLMPVSAASDNKQESNNKAYIQDELVEAFEENDNVKYLVVMEEQADTEHTAQGVEVEAQKKDLSSEDAKVSKQEAVVNQLMDTAEATQTDVSAYLQKATEKKQVKEFDDFYIMNGFSVTGNVDSAEKIIEIPGVKSVLLDDKEELIEPDVEEGNKALDEEDDVEWNIDRMEAPEVWERGITGEGVVVANIDSGADWRHPALTEKYRGYNPDDPDNPDNEFNWFDATSEMKEPVDADEHGTHTIGTMVGQEEDGANKIGMAPDAEWIAARAFSGDEAYDSEILAAAEWLIAPTGEDGEAHPEKAPDIINNSWGGNPIDNDWFLPMVQSWRSAGIIPIFSAGNTTLFMGQDPGTVSAPGNYEEVLAVGALDKEDQLTDFSLLGPTEDGRIKPDVSAPGVEVRSSVPGEDPDEAEYDVMSGTSMSAPAVAGTVALMLSVDDTLSMDAVSDVLKSRATEGTDDEFPDSPNNGYGYGQVNANKVVKAVEKGIGSIDGQVVGEGTDDASPSFEEDVRKVVFEGEEEHFSVQAADNISVDDVTLLLTDEDGNETSYTAERMEGDHQDGLYDVTVPADDITGSSMEYQWKIEDFSGNEETSEVHELEVKEGITDGYTQDFEKYPDGWYSFGDLNVWEWGEPEYGPEKAASGDKVMGTNLEGNYEPDSDMTLVMPPVLVEDGTELKFKQWYELSPFGWDTGEVYVSRDKENWESVLEVQDENTSWHETGIDLSEYAGEKIYIGFNLSSLDNENPGWYIDDVKLENEESSSAEYQASGKENEQFTSGDSIHQVSIADNEDFLPVEATIEIEETGWETEADPQDGTFSIHDTPGEYTLNIDAYGYQSTTKMVSISEDGTASPEITLKKAPKQTISGTVEDHFGNGVKKAQVAILEDEHSIPVKTAADGSYEIEAYEGTYTLRVTAKGYYNDTEEITVDPGEDIDLDITLDPFYQDDDEELAYDNGNYDKNLAMGTKGNGFAVKMSLDEGEDLAMLTGAKLQFWAEHVPVPGGEDITISVYDSSGEDGTPGKKIAGPFDAKAKRDLDQWTEVDLSDEGIIVDDDFYVLYTQAADYPYIPGFVSDGDEENTTGRSWDYLGGQWFQADEASGNYMIRALIDYGDEAPDLAKPVIDAPDDGDLTDEKEIKVTGNATPDSDIQLTDNGENIGDAKADSDGKFSLDVEMDEGENEFQAVAIADDSPVAASDTVTVTLDTKAPVLTIDSPEDGDTIEEDSVVVEGTATDEHLDWVKVNEEEVSLDDDSFSSEISLEKGENDITVEAMDEVGNDSSETIIVTYEEDEGVEDPIVENIKPASDQNVSSGDEVNVHAESNIKGGVAKFKVSLPASANSDDKTENTMEEVEDGVYEGKWEVPDNLEVDGAVIEIQVSGDDDVQAAGKADGKVYVSNESVDRISGDLRYDTAVETSKKGWDEADTVVIARGLEYADSLAGVPLAHKLDAPILLTPTDELWEAAADEIERLGASDAIILGGTDAVDDDVSSELEALGLDVERISGKDRFGTAEKIAAEVAPDGTNEVAVANGMDFPDALSVASHAADEEMPILLTKSDWMADSTRQAIDELGATESIAIGGTEVIDESILNTLPEATRLSGHDRYETNIAVNEHFDAGSEHMYVATGEEYADALTGAVLAAKDESTILLVHRKVPDVVKDYITEQKAKHLSIFGGQQAVDDSVLEELKGLLQ